MTEFYELLVGVAVILIHRSWLLKRKKREKKIKHENIVKGTNRYTASAEI